MIELENRSTYLESEGNLALANTTADRTHLPLRPSFHLVCEDALAIDPLGPARGMVVGAALSIMLWCFIIFMIVGFIEVIYPMLGTVI